MPTVQRIFLWSLGIALSALFVGLGRWQLQRAAYKEDLQHRFETVGAPRALLRAADLHEWQRVSVRGEWMVHRSVLLDNRLRQGHAGFEVLTPLRLEPSHDIVIINRGWVADTGDRRLLPIVPTPTGIVELNGLALNAVPPGFNLASARQEGAIWQKADLASFQRLLGQPVGNWLVRQESNSDDSLNRDWAPPDFGADKHRAYALQWFAMAATLFMLSGWHAIRSWRTGRMTSLPESSQRMH